MTVKALSIVWKTILIFKCRCNANNDDDASPKMPISEFLNDLLFIFPLKIFHRKWVIINKNSATDGAFSVLWRRYVMVVITVQLHLTKPELRLCAGSNPARSVSEIWDGEVLWQWSRLEIRLNTFRWSTISQKQIIIITLLLA